MEESHSVAGVPSLQYVRTILIDASCSSEAFSRFTCLSGGAKKAIMKELSLLGIDPFSEAAGELRRRPVGAPLNSTHFRGTHVPVARSGVRPVYRGHGSAAIGAGRRTAGRTRSSVVLAWHRGLCIVASLVA